MFVGRTRGAKPSYYVVFVTSSRRCHFCAQEHVQGRVEQRRALAHLTVITPDTLEEKMTFVNADEMAKTIRESGRSRNRRSEKLESC
jgi:hypothetical protein